MLRRFSIFIVICRFKIVVEILVGSVPDVVNVIVPLNMAELPRKLWFKSLKLINRCLWSRQTRYCLWKMPISKWHFHVIYVEQYCRDRQLYDNSKPFAVFHDNMTKGYNHNYPFNILEIMTENENHPQGNITLRANYWLWLGTLLLLRKFWILNSPSY